MRENCSKQISIGKQLIAAYVNREHTIKTYKKRKKQIQRGGISNQ